MAKRPRIFGEHYAHNIADVDEPTRSLQSRWIIDGSWKLIVPDPRNQPDAKPELYDLRNGPWEKNDFGEEESGRVAELRKKLDAWWIPPSRGV